MGAAEEAKAAQETKAAEEAKAAQEAEATEEIKAAEETKAAKAAADERAAEEAVAAAEGAETATAAAMPLLPTIGDSVVVVNGKSKGLNGVVKKIKGEGATRFAVVRLSTGAFEAIKLANVQVE